MQHARSTTIFRRTVVLILLATIVLLGYMRPHIMQLTSTGTARGLYDLSVPGLDLGIDVIPATVGHAGYLEVWCYPHGADDITILFVIPGAPPLPVSIDTIEVSVA
jgi:hypothetical protein